MYSMRMLRESNRVPMSEAALLRSELAGLEELMARLDATDPARAILLANRKEIEEELSEMGLTEDGVRHIT